MSSPAVLANNTLVKIAGADVSADMNQVKLAATQGEIDTSTFGASGWKDFIVSIGEYTLDYTGFFNKASGASDAVVFGLFGAPASSSTWEVDVPNSSTGSIKYSGNGWGKSFSPFESKVNDAIKMAASLRGTGALVRAVI